MKNTFVKVLSFLMALTMIVGMFGAMTISATEHTHTKGELVTKVEATCANIGYSKYKCAECGEEFIPDDEVVLTSETCTGIKPIEATEATCTWPAMTAGERCTHCGKYVEGKEPKPVEGSNPLGHYFIGASRGTTTCDYEIYYYCAICGKDYEDCVAANVADTALSALQAKYPKIEWYNGWSDDYLSVPNELFGQHDFKYEIITAPTTCVDGVLRYACTICGKKDDITIYATHDYTDTFASCEGYVGVKCAECGRPQNYDAINHYPEHEWELDANGDIKVYHEITAALEKQGYTNETVYKAPTCTETGYKIQYCEFCEIYVVITIDADGHNWGSVKTVVNTKENGYLKGCAALAGKTSTRTCKTCKEVEVLHGTPDMDHVFTYEVVAPTCVDEGYTIETCLNPVFYENCEECTNAGKTECEGHVGACGYERKFDYVEKTGHSWISVYKQDGVVITDVNNIDHSKEIVKATYCAVPGCTATKDDVVVTPATINNANADDNIYAGDSTTGYYYDYKGVSYEATADGHVLSDEMFYTGATCVINEYLVRQCILEGCGMVFTCDRDGKLVSYENRVEKENSTNDYHEAHMLKKIAGKNPISATCTAPGANYYFCQACNTEQLVYDIPAKGHNLGLKYTVDGTVKKDLSFKAPTCVSDGKTEGLLCTRCGVVFVEQETIAKDPKAHTTEGFKNKIEIVGMDFPANCQNFGYKYYYFPCCGEIDYVEKTEGQLDPSVHINVEVHESVAPTCTTAGSHLWYACNGCGEVVVTKEFTDRTDLKLIVNKNDETGKVTYEKKEAVTYTCYCGSDELHEDVDVSKIYDVPAINHNVSKKSAYTYIEAKPETCTENGWEAHYQYVCTAGKKKAPCDVFKTNGSCEHACGCKDGFKILIKHSNRYVGKIVAKAATCTTKGISIVDANGNPVEKITNVCTQPQCWDAIEGYTVSWIDELNHDIVTMPQNVNSGDCTVPTYDVEICARGCGEVYALRYVPAKYTAHEWSVAIHTFANVDGFIQRDGKWVNFDVNGNWYEVASIADAAPACCYPTYSYQSCEHRNCYAEKIDETTYKAPISHYTYETDDGSKLEITWSCKGFNESLNYTCELCGEMVEKGEMVHTGIQLVTRKETCTENGYMINYCFDCNTEITRYEIQAYGHNPFLATGIKMTNSGDYKVNPVFVEYIVELVDSTASTPGFIKYFCKKCQAVVTAEIAPKIKVDLDFTTDDYIVNNGTFTVDVAISASEFNFNSLYFAVLYDNTAVKFLSAELVYAFDENDQVTLVANDNVVNVGYNTSVGYARVNVYAPNNGLTNEYKNVELDGEKIEFVTLTFKVLPTATYEVYKNMYDEDVKAPVIFDAGFDADITVVNKDGVLEDKAVDSSVVTIDEEALSLTYLGDLNDDGKIDGYDSVAMMDIMYKVLNPVEGEEVAYSAVADINRDGVINLADHAALLQFTVTTQTMIDYLAMMGITIDGIVAEYELRVDLDNDKDVDDSDKAFLANALNRAFAKENVHFTEMTELLVECGCTTLEELVDMVAYDLQDDGKINGSN